MCSFHTISADEAHHLTLEDLERDISQRPDEFISRSAVAPQWTKWAFQGIPKRLRQPALYGSTQLEALRNSFGPNAATLMSGQMTSAKIRSTRRK